MEQQRGWWLWRANWVPLLAAVVLGVVGVFFVFSACSARAVPAVRLQWLGHLRFLLVGVGLAAVTAWLDYRLLLRWSWVLYGGVLALLGVVLVAGVEIFGAKRWVFGVQPSEFAKLAVILVLARLLARWPKRMRGPLGLFAAGALVLVPMGLILLQPDLGTALVLVPTVFAMLFAANVSPKLLWSIVLAGVVVAGLEVGAVYWVESGGCPPVKRAQVVRLTGLRPHQWERIDSFLFPDKDILGSGYNKRQSEIAVGSGGLWGKGFLNGDQNVLGFLPQAVSSNDFIFAVIAEEIGFVGCVGLIVLFVLGVLFPGVWIGLRCQDDGGKLIVVGITTLLFAHLFINIAMTIGLVPVTGLPLPFLSYGGSFMLSMLLGVGLLVSVSWRGRERRGFFRSSESVEE